MNLPNSSYYLQLTPLIQHLETQGLAIGIDTHLQVQQLFAGLSADSDANTYKNYLRALLCKSEKEVLIFEQSFPIFCILEVEELKPESSESKNQIHERVDFWGGLKQHWLDLIQRLKTFIGNFRPKSLVAERVQGNIPDYYTRIVVPHSFSIRLTAEIQQSAARLRTREGVGAHRLDIPKTIIETVRQLGAFVPVEVEQQRYTEYLILIDAGSRNDHRAKLYDAFFQELQERHIPSDRYFFRQNPFEFYQNNPQESLRLDIIARRYADAVWLVFAGLHTFLRYSDTEPYAWVSKKFRTFHKGYLMLPFGSRLDARIAHKLKNIFTDVLTADSVGFEQLEALLNQRKEPYFAETIQFRKSLPLFPIPTKTEDDMASIPTYLPDKRLLAWIAACAVYPDNSWQMTLFIGNALSTEAFQYNTWQNIQQLTRLDWFQQSYIPDNAKEFIAQQNWINQEDKQRIKQYIEQTIRESLKRPEDDLNELTRIYNYKRDKHIAHLQNAIETEGDFVTAKLIARKDLNELLVFDLSRLEEQIEKEVSPEETSVMHAEETAFKDEMPKKSGEKETSAKIEETQSNIFNEPLMQFVQGGSFLMGSDKGNKTEMPPHEVILNDFHIGVYPVTVEEYMAFCEETNSHFPEWLEVGSQYHVVDGDDDHYKKIGYEDENARKKLPVVGVNWHNAFAYTQWLSLKTGKKYRLPTEAEWEYAAKGGTQSKGYEYAGSNNLDEVAWYSGNSRGKPHTVGTKKPNELEVYDMSGNVLEWCADWYDSDYYAKCAKQGAVLNPTGPASASYRVYRGGSWNYGAGNCRVAHRGYWGPTLRNFNLGFRLALSLEAG